MYFGTSFLKFVGQALGSACQKFGLVFRRGLAWYNDIMNNKRRCLDLGEVEQHFEDIKNNIGYSAARHALWD